MHLLYRLSFYLLSIHLHLPECIVYIYSILYPESCPCLSRICPFLQHLGPYPTTTQTLTLEKLNLIQRILSLYCATHRLTGWPHLPYLFVHHTSPFPFSFFSVKESNSNFLSLKTSTTSSLFAVPYVPLSFYVFKRFT